MSKKTIILNPKYFKYPTEKELLKIGKMFPKLTHFEFDSVQIFQVFDKTESLKELNIKDNLYWWDNSLCNKLGKLRISYSNVVVNFNRNIEQHGFEIISEKSINKILFDFYIETLYYYLFSSRDIIYQIINVFYNLGVEENEFGFNNKVKNLIEDAEIIELIEELSGNLKQASEIRNSFTHRFPPNKKDYRTKYSETSDFCQLDAGSENKINDNKIIENIEYSIKSLESFIIGLKKLMKF